MRVFVTGATGFIGSAIVSELIANGHEVVGLARSESSAASLVQAGAIVHRGSLEDHESLRSGAAAADGVIHTAFIHDFSQFVASAGIDQRAISVMLETLQGSNKPFVAASGTMLFASSLQEPAGMESSASNPASLRAGSDAMVLAAAARGVRSSVVRLPPTVHGKGDHGFIPMLIALARERGYAAYVGDGMNRWPAVHRLDAAHLFRLGLESASPGSALIAVAEEGIPVRTIAETIANGLGTTARSFDPDEAGAYFTWLTAFIAADNHTAVNEATVALGWKATQMRLLDDMEQNGYFGI